MARNTHKKQHVIPRSYLAAWCDPQTPKGWEPYVWVWKKVGSQPERRSPGNVFTQTDMYTVMVGDERLLHLEHGLSQLETKFELVRRRFIAPGLLITAEEKVYLSAFVVAMMNRTARQKDHHQRQFGQLLGRARRLEERVRDGGYHDGMATGISSADSSAIGIDELQAVVDQPLDVLLPTAIDILTPIYADRNFSFLRAPSGMQYITSDNPVLLYDPARPRGSFWGIAPASPTIELTMPISPTTCVVIAHKAENGFYEAPASFVRRVNDGVRAAAESHYISTSGEVGVMAFSPLPGLVG
ncbi:DUF4238 domain-containing protein [Aurantimonas coralicida]|uniref:DUF4238 domain-containing protein n=1 Tax=Aurantimonas coralicida TaxID=182270 RepID=UPI0009DB701A|nr:DUF4238 domain-containing protein [Aurantimonas coralicida]